MDHLTPRQRGLIETGLDAARRIALDDHRRQRAELQATLAAEQRQP